MTKNEFIQELNNCRNAQRDAEKLLDSLIEKVEFEFDIELEDTNCTIGNFFSIDEAIQDYVQNGEDYDAESIWNDILDNL